MFLMPKMTNELKKQNNNLKLNAKYKQQNQILILNFKLLSL